MLHGTIVAESRSGAVRITETRYPGGAVLAHHCHAEPYISVLVEGDYTEVRSGDPQRCAAGTVIVHHRGEVHADYFPRSGRCLNVEVLDRSHPARAVLNRGTLAGSSPRLQAALVRLVRLHVDAEREPAIDEVLAAIVDDAVAPIVPRPAWLSRALDEFSWTDALPLERIAHGVGVHPTHFSRAFRRHMGLAPNAFRRASRIRAASKLLLESTAGLADVAQVTGFHDQSHLTHVFVTVSGMAPARFRSTFGR